MIWPEAFVIVALLACGAFVSWLFLHRGDPGMSESAKILEHYRERDRRQWRKEDGAKHEPK